LNAVTELHQQSKTKFVYIGTVAEYGNRTFKHPWGRVGDPLMPSAFDVYAASKVKATIEKTEPKLITKVELIDIYENNLVLAGKRSLTFRIYIQSMD